MAAKTSWARPRASCTRARFASAYSIFSLSGISRIPPFGARHDRNSAG